MEKSKFCPKCGSLLTDDAVFCSQCGRPAEPREIVVATDESQLSVVLSPSEINTVEDMENYLQELSKHANQSAEAALKAQLQVIRYVQSPELYDSSFDMLFKCIKDALRYAESPKMREQIRERATIMIQNYIFFMNARLQFEVAVNKKEYEELMEDACKVLAESTAEVVATAVPGGSAAKMTMKIAVAQVARDMFASKDKNGNGLLARAYRWYTKDTRTREKRGEFMQTINMLTTKLHKHREIIGKSDLVAGIIKRYARDMTEYFYREKLEVAKCQCIDVNERARNSELIALGIILVGNVLVLLIRWIFKGIENRIFHVSAKIAEEEYVADSTHWALHQWGYALAFFAFVSFLIFIIYLYNRKKVKKALAIVQKEYNDSFQNYLNIAAEFEE